MTTKVSEQGFVIANLENNSEITIYYKDIRKFAETKNYYLFITKANFHVNEGKRDAFFSFLRSRQLK